MIQFKALKISFDYSREHDLHNHDLVGYVIQKYPRKVTLVKILTRSSVDQWYNEVKEKYPRDKYIFLLGTVCLIGTVLGIQNDEVELEEDEVEGDSPYVKRPRDPSAN
jgi:hypothetical protein